MPADPVAATKARNPSAGSSLAQVLEDALERGAGREVVDEVVPELGELVEDHVLRIGCELLAAVVDLLDVRLRARRADDVSRLDDPPLEPVEPLPAHALGQDGDAAAAEEARDGDAAPAVVARGRPDGAIARRVEPPRDEPGHEAPVGGEDLVRADQREAISERDHDPCVDAGELAGEHDVLRDVDDVDAIGSVVPVDTEEVQRMRFVRPDGSQRLANGSRDELRARELREGRERNAGLAKTVDDPLDDDGVDDIRFRVVQVRGHGASWSLPPTLGASEPLGFGASAQCRSVFLRTAKRLFRPVGRSARPWDQAAARPSSS